MTISTKENTMQGMALSRELYSSTLPLLQRRLPELCAHAAFGLVGEGSECFGFDDEISRDHDWGPAFCIWFPEAELDAWTRRLEPILVDLPPVFEGFPTRMAPSQRMGRVGPLSIEGFYARFLGLSQPPQTWRQWRALPESFLAVCTNGAVFADEPGTFSAFREALLAYYPEDVRLKKLAARCMGMAQAGQYNLLRSLHRGETAASMLAAARFAEQALSLVFLLNHRYMPFYKWAHRAVGALPILGTATRDRLTELAGLDWKQGAHLEDCAGEVVERLCHAVAEQLRTSGLSDATDDWLLAHGPSVQSRIKTPEIRAIPVLLD
ncbi:MAG: DUF4037 domain-containing protein [Bilophila sp.]